MEDMGSLPSLGVLFAVQQQGLGVLGSLGLVPSWFVLCQGGKFGSIPTAGLLLPLNSQWSLGDAGASALPGHA